MAYTIDEDGKISKSKAERMANYTVEDKKNVINFQKSGRKTPKPYELESLKRQYGKPV